MKNRNQTLMTNVGIYVGIVALVGFNFWFWKSYVGKSRVELADMRTNLDKLKKEKVDKKAALDKAGATKRSYGERIEQRRNELVSYGEFLKPIKDKPDSIEQLQQLIEKQGIEIRKAIYNPASKGEGNYSAFSFTMELEGPYKSFKMLLSQLPKQVQIFRVQSFDVLNYENSRHNWEVKLQLETYFSGTG